MQEKSQVLLMLRGEFDRWEELLASFSQEEIISPQLPTIWSIKDVVAHLWAWQQVSIARLEAARLVRQPVLPDWLAGLDPESDEHLEQFNATIYDTHCQQPWADVHQKWRDGFLRFLALAEMTPEQDLLDPQKHPWLKGYSLLAVLEGSLGHHREHREALLAVS